MSAGCEASAESFRGCRFRSPRGVRVALDLDGEKEERTEPVG